MKAVIVNFRGSFKQMQGSNRLVILPEGAAKKEGAEKLVNKKITWTSPKGKIISGKITGAHGSKGAVRALFEKGLPGQALGTQAKIE